MPVNSRFSYSPSFKRRALARIKAGFGIGEVAGMLGVAESTLHRWVSGQASALAKNPPKLAPPLKRQCPDCGHTFLTLIDYQSHHLKVAEDPDKSPSGDGSWQCFPENQLHAMGYEYFGGMLGRSTRQ